MPETPLRPHEDKETPLHSLLEKLSASLKHASKSGNELLETGKVSQTEEARRELRKDCQDSLYFLIRAVLGYKDLVPHVHLPVCLFLTKWSTRRKLLEMGRGHFKSTCGSIGLPIWLEIQALFGDSWNSLLPTRLHVLLRSNTGTNAELFLQEVRALQANNALFKWLFPELAPQSRDILMNERIWVNRPVVRIEDGQTVQLDFRIDAIGTGGSAVSRHFDGIIDDDLVDEDEADSETQMDKVIREHKRSESLFVEPSAGRYWLIGTRWAFNDLLSHVRENEPDVDRYWLPAEDPTDTTPVTYEGRVFRIGRPVFPERFSQEELARIQAKQGPYIYSCFYKLHPVPEEDQIFHPDWIQYYDRLPRNLKVVFCCDPAISTKDKADYTGMAGIGVSARGPDEGFDIYVLHAKRARYQPHDLIGEMYDLTQIWKPVAFGFEEIGFQRAYRYPIQLLRSRYSLAIPYTPAKWPKQSSKEARIRSLQPYFACGQIWLHKDQKDLVTELLRFPGEEHDDILDALAYAVFLATPEGGASLDLPQPVSPWVWKDDVPDGRCELSVDYLMDELQGSKHDPGMAAAVDESTKLF